MTYNLNGYPSIDSTALNNHNFVPYANIER